MRSPVLLNKYCQATAYHVLVSCEIRKMIKEPKRAFLGSRLLLREVQGLLEFKDTESGPVLLGIALL